MRRRLFWSASSSFFCFGVERSLQVCAVRRAALQSEIVYLWRMWRKRNFQSATSAKDKVVAGATMPPEIPQPHRHRLSDSGSGYKKREVPNELLFCSTRSRDRTGTAITGHRILSPACLPIPPSGPLRLVRGHKSRKKIRLSKIFLAIKPLDYKDFVAIPLPPPLERNPAHRTPIGRCAISCGVNNLLKALCEKLVEGGFQA